MNLRIGLDIDDTLVDFFGEYIKKFNKPKDLINYNITRNVNSLQKNKNFWENLPKIREIECEVTLYCTKRINSKIYTKNSLIKNNFPIKPIYQISYQRKNKADLIKGRVDVFIDDSIENVIQMNKSGIITLLIDHPRNQHFEFPGRIHSLKQEEIYLTYNFLKNSNFKF